MGTAETCDATATDTLLVEDCRRKFVNVNEIEYVTDELRRLLGTRMTWLVYTQCWLSQAAKRENLLNNLVFKTELEVEYPVTFHVTACQGRPAAP